MFMTKLKKALALVYFLSVLLAGFGWAAHQQTEPALQSKQEAQQQPPPQDGEKLVQNQKREADFYGDPLPPGAVARMGTNRLVQVGWADAVVFSPNGKILASSGNANTISLWDAATGKRLLELKGHQHGVTGIAFSPDSKTLASSSYDATVRLWDTASGKELHKIPGTPNAGFGNVVISKDGKYLVTSGFDNAVRVFDPSTGNEIRSFRGRLVAPHGIAISADSKYLAGCVDQTLHIWETATGNVACTIPLQQQDAAWSLAFSPDGKILAMSWSGATFQPVLFDAQTGKELRRLPCRASQRIAFAPVGAVLASGGAAEGAIAFWDPATGKELERFGAAVYSKVGCKCVAFSPDGQSLASCGYENVVHIWNVKTGEERFKFDRHPNAVSALVFAPNGKSLFSGSGSTGGAQDKRIRQWDTAIGKQTGLIEGFLGVVNSVALSPDGQTLAVTSSSQLNDGNDRQFRLLDRATGKDILKQQGQATTSWVKVAAFAPDSKTVALGSTDGTVRLIDRATGKERQQLGEFAFTFQKMKFNAQVLSLVFSPDGKMLTASATGGGGYVRINNPKGGYDRVTVPVHNEIRRWDVVTGKEISKIVDTKMIGVLSPDVITMAAGTYDGKVQISDVATGQLMTSTPGHVGGIQCMAYSPDGSLLATGGGIQSTDYAVRLWEVVTGKEIGKFEGHSGTISALAFAADGKTLASGSDDMSALLWDLTPPKLKAAKDVTAKELDDLSALLAGNDAAAAYQAGWKLAAAGQKAVDLLKQRLKPAPIPPGEARIRQLIEELDSDKFAVREAASQELRKLGVAAKPLLLEALKKDTPLETRQRVEKLLEGLKDAPLGQLSAETISRIRAIFVLERIGTPDACRVLEILAQGAAGARETAYAQAALKRLQSV
jgi:WD40 repeat protein